MLCLLYPDNIGIDTFIRVYSPYDLHGFEGIHRVAVGETAELVKILKRMIQCFGTRLPL
jgi:hypothetical protein